MDNSHKNHVKVKPILGVAIAGLVTLVWSLGLIVRGIWQYRQSSIQASNAQNASDFASVPNVATGVFDYGGSTAWAALRLAVDPLIQLERPELKLRYVQPAQVPPGSNPGIEMLLENQLAFVQSSHPLSSETYQRAKQQGLKLKQVPVAVDSVAVVVHPQLNISGLTLAQLQAIYTGQISNWQQLGGPDLTITPYSRPPSTGGMVDFFAARVLQNQEFSSRVELVSTTTQALRQLANNPGGIYYGSTPAIVPQCSVKPLPIGLQGNNLVAPYRQLVPTERCPQQRNQLNMEALRNAQYPLTHYLYVVFLEEQGERSQVGRAYANFLLTQILHQEKLMC
ncbi:substrate-binding domain-containing protein [Pleurocapsales cyanobacterium LEGE 10410]|nr:substrate-binding domain-containing protein [Pleurocapsales cyanobacterium LEGE 10410]